MLYNTWLEGEGLHILLKCVSPKMNVIARLECRHRLFPTHCPLNHWNSLLTFGSLCHSLSNRVCVAPHSLSLFNSISVCLSLNLNLLKPPLSLSLCGYMLEEVIIVSTALEGFQFFTSSIIVPLLIDR